MSGSGLTDSDKISSSAAARVFPRTYETDAALLTHQDDREAGCDSGTSQHRYARCELRPKLRGDLVSVNHLGGHAPLHRTASVNYSISTRNCPSIGDMRCPETDVRR